MGFTRQWKKVKGALFGHKAEDPTMQTLEVDPDTKRTQEAARGAQRQGLSSLMKSMNAPRASASDILGAQERSVRGVGEDAARNIRSQIARSGMGRSSIGLSALIGAKRKTGQQLGDIRAQAPLLRNQLADQAMARQQQLIGGAGNILARPGEQRQAYGMPGKAATSGLAPMLFGMGGAGAGGIAGGMFGGPGGAAAGSQAGGQAGSGFGQGLSGLFRR